MNLTRSVLVSSLAFGAAGCIAAPAPGLVSPHHVRFARVQHVSHVSDPPDRRYAPRPIQVVEPEVLVEEEEPVTVLQVTPWPTPTCDASYSRYPRYRRAVRYDRVRRHRRYNGRRYAPHRARRYDGRRYAPRRYDGRRYAPRRYDRGRYAPHRYDRGRYAPSRVRRSDRGRYAPSRSRRYAPRSRSRSYDGRSRRRGRRYR